MTDGKSFADFVESLADDPEFEAERIAIEILEAATDIMSRNGLTRAELARRLGVSRGAVTQLFGKNSTNLTLLTMVRLAKALDAEFSCEIVDGVLSERRPYGFDLSLIDDSDLIAAAENYEATSSLPAAA